jgi:hypothetical protein
MDFNVTVKILVNFYAIKPLRMNGKTVRYLLLFALRNPVIQLELWFHIISSLTFV